MLGGSFYRSYTSAPSHTQKMLVITKAKKDKQNPFFTTLKQA